MRLFSSFKLSKANMDLLAKHGFTVDWTDDRPYGADLAKKFSEYDIVLVGIAQKIDTSMLTCVKKPLVIATMSMGTDHLKDAINHPMVTILNCASGNAVSVAEHIFALILALRKKLLESKFLAWSAKGHRFNLSSRPYEINGKTLGLVGAGNITREVIKIARVFNLKLLCHTLPHPDNDDLVKLGVKFVELDELLRTSDIVNILVPLNDSTHNLISAEKIALLRPDATFINCARTAVVDTHALIDYADKHPTFNVGLDIDISDNPKFKSDKNYEDLEKLFAKQRKNVIVTPHTAGLTHEAVQGLENEIIGKICELSGVL